MKSKPNKLSFFSLLPYFILFPVLFVNLYFYLFRPDPYTQIRQSLFSLSRGSRYYARLRLWYFLAQKGFWDQAAKIEKYLDPVDIHSYKSTYHPQAVFQKINQLCQKNNKTASDWLVLAQLQFQAGLKDQALESVAQAQALDPIRSDIHQFYSQLNSSP